ncbi:MAG: chromosome segregation protein SMC [Calditrichia bacterium]
MYLSKLEIFGFKSFAHKVQFIFNDGITAIIGPNGCGKSNIVDAIRWVLGEQRTSLLRLDKMENVIFNGTALRKPLSMADVSLYIENTRNILPSIYTEVKITRRLFRSGESEYLINNRPVRLKDIIDLFADTGMGSDAYSVIELKMVEQILSENAEERRRLFEEAAGIKKYKIRRKSAMRKLETTEQELLRLNDVIAEVQRNVNSLSRQVGKARRYHKFKDELRQNELYIFQLRQQVESQDLIPLQQEETQIRQTRERLGKDIQVGEAELEKLQMKAVDLERKFREVANRLNEADGVIRDKQQVIRLNDHRIESITENIQKSETEIAEFRQRIQSLQEQLTEVRQNKEKTAKASREKQNAYRSKANAQLEVETRLQSVRGKFQEFREKNAAGLEEITRLRAEHQRLSIQKQNLQQRREKLSLQLKNLQKELSEKEATFRQVETEWERAREEEELYQEEIKLLRAQIEEIERGIQAREDEKNKLLGNIEKQKSQCEFLENLIQNYQGFSEGVQYVMTKKEKYNGLIDTLANMVDIQEDYREALESYLQEMANYLVVEEVETARNILVEIRQQQKGRITLVPLSHLNANSHHSAVPAETNGDILPLKDLIKYDSRYSRLFNFLFENLFLVENMDKALEYRSRYPELNFLTRDGEFIGVWGNITGGNLKHHFSLTGRKQQLDRARREWNKLLKKEESLKKEIEAAGENRQAKRIKTAELEKLISEQNQTVSRLEQEKNKKKYEIDYLGNQLQETEEELKSLGEQLEELQVQEARLHPLLQDADRKQKEFQEREAAFNREFEAVEEEYRKISHEVQQLQMEYLSQQNQLNELHQRESYLQRTTNETTQQIERAEKLIENYRREIERIESDNAELKQQLDSHYTSRDAIEKEKLEVENNYQSLRSLIMAREEELKKIHRRWNQAFDRLKELELKIQEVQVRQKSRREQMADQFGDQLDGLLQANPLPPNVTLAELQENITDLRRKIEALGEVNPLAVREYEQEKERLDFLLAQRKDLLDAKQELMETIRKLNKTARTLFLETFEKVHQNFRHVFSKFFEGGEAELKLEENADPLEANIEISVRIKGRKLSTLNLMSAGEKTLTAISLLFAIYLVKPSPFCILDEVDAPLDDVNISRYTRALKEFSANTQFILVTHNKMTMQAAQAMYGITMEEPGVSKVVSVRFD